MAGGSGSWPVAKYHFRVEIEGKTCSFQEVSGLQVESPVIEYRVGGKNIPTAKLVGTAKTSNLVLKKGIFKDDKELAKLFGRLLDNEFYDENKKFNITIHLLDETGNIVMTWNVIRAYPVKLQGADLKSTENAAAVEMMEFAYEELKTE